MSQPEPLTELNDEDIVQFQPRDIPDFTPHMMKFGRFRKAVEPALNRASVNEKVTDALDSESVKTYAFCNYNRTGYFQNWFQDGVDCEILKLGDAQWQRGKLRMRVSLEFIPDEPPQESEDSDESPLAEIRQEIAGK